jgi:hypothetical protein
LAIIIKEIIFDGKHARRFTARNSSRVCQLRRRGRIILASPGETPMNATDAIFQRALTKLLGEIFDGPPGEEAYILNAGDPGLLRQLESIPASAASTRPMPGKTTIAAHVDHVHFGLTFMNRWAAGEANPFAGADWNSSWQRTAVTDEQWRVLCDKLRHEFQTWRNVVGARTDWDDVAAAGALSSAAHTAYHLGAIRQILAGMNR